MLEPYVETLETIARTPTPTVGKLPRLTNRQLDFLRNLRKHPNSLPLMTWPRATTLRKWMRRPRFAAAIRGLEEAFQIESRLVMAGAAASAAVQLQAMLTGGSRDSSGAGIGPCELALYEKSTRQCLGVLWAEMARRAQLHRVGLQRQQLRRMGEAMPPQDDADAGSESVL